LKLSAGGIELRWSGTVAGHSTMRNLSMFEFRSLESAAVRSGWPDGTLMNSFSYDVNAVAAAERAPSRLSRGGSSRRCTLVGSITNLVEYNTSMDAVVSLRRLGPADVALLRSLNVLFGKAFGDSETYTQAPPSDAYLSGLLAKEHMIVLAALVAGRIVAGLIAYELDKCERPRRELYIYDLAVDERHRRQGIATALIERLRKIAAQRGAWVVYVQADYGDAAAIALYEKLGVREHVMHFDMPVVGVRRSARPRMSGMPKPRKS
jgi:aminoglycoside 3-N-acetyltransferase I